MISLTVTKRFIWMIGAGIVVTFISYFFSISLLVFIIYNILCFTLLTIDYFTTPSSDVFEIERVGEEKLSLYAMEKIKFRVYNKSDKEMYIEIVDEAPELYFEVQEKSIKGSVLPHSKEIFEYEAIPRKRGAFSIGSVHVRYEGNLKLCKKQFILALKKEYKVYPNLKDLKKYRLAAYNSMVNQSGQKVMKMLGNGTEFESLREYVSGDEYRKINWQATARENKPIVNQYEPEKNQHVYTFIDTGRPMSYSVKGYKKLDLAINTSLLLSDIVNQNGDQSGLMVFNTEVNNFVMPGKGNIHRNNLMEALYHIEHTNETSNYDEAFYYFKTKERRRSLICIFTDFDTLEEAEDMMKVLPVLSRNNIVMIILINDEKLQEIASISVEKEDDSYKKGVALEMLRERKKMINILNAKGIMCIQCSPEKISIEVINKYLHIKNRMFF